MGSAKDTHVADIGAVANISAEDIKKIYDAALVGDVSFWREGDQDVIAWYNWDKTNYDEAQEASDSGVLEERWSEFEDAMVSGDTRPVDLTPDDNKIRGFGGGMPVVVEGDDYIDIYGPRRDFGPIAFKGVLDIPAERSQALGIIDGWADIAREEFDVEEEFLDRLEMKAKEAGFGGDNAREETWEELIHRSAEEILLVEAEEGYNALLPEYGDEELDFVVQMAAMQELIKAKTAYSDFSKQERSHLYDRQIGVDTYEAKTLTGDKPIKVILKDFYDRGKVEFEASIVPEPETSSLEGVKISLVDEDVLPDDFVLQDTEVAEAGEDFVMLDRIIDGLRVSEDGVVITSYQSSEVKEEYAVETYFDKLDQDFEDNLLSQVDSREELDRLNSLFNDLLADESGRDELYLESFDEVESLQDCLAEEDSYRPDELWTEIKQMGDGYDSGERLYEDLDKALELRESLGEEYASRHGTVKMVKALEDLKHNFSEYESQLDYLADRMSEPAPARKKLPWVSQDP